MSPPAQEMNRTDFESKVLKRKSPAVIDFWADWCGPCKMMAPIVEGLAKSFEGRVLVGKIDLDEHPEVATRFNVMSIPTLIFFKGGKEHSRLVGVTTHDEVIRKTKEIL